MTSNVSGTDFNDINGTVDARNILVIKNGKRYVIDSLVCASVSKAGQTRVSIESTILGGQFDGTIAPGELPEVLKEHFAHYFTLQG